MCHPRRGIVCPKCPSKTSQLSTRISGLPFIYYFGPHDKKTNHVVSVNTTLKISPLIVLLRLAIAIVVTRRVAVMNHQ